MEWFGATVYNVGLRLHRLGNYTQSERFIAVALEFAAKARAGRQCVLGATPNGADACPYCVRMQCAALSENVPNMSESYNRVLRKVHEASSHGAA